MVSSDQKERPSNHEASGLPASIQRGHHALPP
jgi:hypothetical protein